MHAGTRIQRKVRPGERCSTLAVRINTGDRLRTAPSVNSVIGTSPCMSCAHWRSTKEHSSEGIVWIYGFWTGLNYVAAASEQAQSGTDATAIVAEVRKTCASDPSQTLASAVWSTYLRFNKK